jgi:hypothetical protein
MKKIMFKSILPIICSLPLCLIQLISFCQTNQITSMNKETNLAFNSNKTVENEMNGSLVTFSIPLSQKMSDKC